MLVDAAIAQADHAVAAVGEAMGVGDHDEGCAVAVAQREQQVDDGFAVGLVEVAGGFVGQQDIGARRDGAGKRHALLFTARHLTREVIGAVGEADGVKFFHRAVKGIAVTRQFQRRGDVFQRGHRGHKVEALEHDAHVIAAKTGQRVFVHRAEILPQGGNLAPRGKLEPAHQHQERGFARTGGTDKTEGFPFRNVKRDAMQDFDPSGIAIQGKTRIFKGEYRSHGGTCLMNRSRQYGGLSRLSKAAALVFALAAPVSAEQVSILALGDSLTQGYGLIEQNGLVPQMRVWLAEQGADVRLVNGGVSGDTTAGGFARAEWSLTEDIDAMMVILGGNDMLRGIAPEAARANLAGILEVAKAKGVAVLLVGMKASNNFGPDYKQAFDAIYPELSAEYDTLLSENFFAGLGAQDPSALRDLMQPDGIHPNAEGVALIVEGLGPDVLALVAEIE